MLQVASTNLASRFLGFEKLLWDMDAFLSSKAPNYPFFDIVKTDKGRRIEIAVAGFTKDNIDVTMNKTTRVLSVTASNEEKKVEKLYASIASRSFNKTFVLEPAVEVCEIKVENCILSIDLLETPKVEQEQVLKLTVK